jgi:hypothetical protein
MNIGTLGRINRVGDPLRSTLTAGQVPTDIVNITDGTTSVRKGKRNGRFVVDITLTSTGFLGKRGIDWINLIIDALDSRYVDYQDGVGTFREAVRGAAYVIDRELTETGFDGVENTDWENIETHKPE